MPLETPGSRSNWKAAAKNRTGNLRFLSNLWNEPAWKLRFRFRRYENFPAAEVVTIPVEVPRKGRRRPARYTFEVGGVKLEVLGVLAPQERWQARGGTSLDAAPCVMLRVARKDESRVHLLRVGNDDAAKAGAYDGGEIEQGVWRFGLGERQGPGPVTLTFAVQHPKDVTFMARATPAQPAAIVKE